MIAVPYRDTGKGYSKVRWILIVLLMCNGIYYIWHSYILNNETMSPNSQEVKASTGAQLQIALLREVTQNVTAINFSADSGVSNENVSAYISTNIRLDSELQSSPPVCWLIGPFKEMVSGRQVVGRMEEVDIAMQLTSVTTKGLPDYWVHLTPQASRRAAIKLLRELQAKKIDSFLITKGELENGISLGFFTQKRLAQKVFTERVKQGYKAIIKEVPRTFTEIWAVFDTSKYGEFTNDLWEKIKVGNGELERRKNYCDKIASIGDLD